jgi:hypothetical protein
VGRLDWVTGHCLPTGWHRLHLPYRLRGDLGLAGCWEWLRCARLACPLPWNRGRLGGSHSALLANEGR